MNNLPMTPSRFFRLATVSAAASLAGCSFIPTYERPTAPVADHYSTLAGTTADSSGRIAAELAWQDFFQDARLKRLIELSLQNNRDLRVAVLSIEQTRAQLRLRQADQLPTVNAGITGTRGPVASGAITSTYSAGLSVTSYELDFFGRVRALSEAAQAQLLGTEEARKTVQISLIASVANTYLTMLADDELLRVTRETVTTRQESLRLTQLKFDNEVVSQLDLSLAQSLLEGAKASMAQAQRQRAQDENALVLLVGQSLPGDLPAGLPVTAQGLVPDLPAGVPSDLLTRRPDVRQAEQQLLANNACSCDNFSSCWPTMPISVPPVPPSFHASRSQAVLALSAAIWTNCSATARPPGPSRHNCYYPYSMRGVTRPTWNQPRSRATSLWHSTRKLFRRVFAKFPTPWPAAPR